MGDMLDSLLGNSALLASLIEDELCHHQIALQRSDPDQAHSPPPGGDGNPVFTLNLTPPETPAEAAQSQTATQTSLQESRDAMASPGVRQAYFNVPALVRPEPSSGHDDSTPAGLAELRRSFDANLSRISSGASLKSDPRACLTPHANATMHSADEPHR